MKPQPNPKLPLLCEGPMPAAKGRTLSERARERAMLELHNGPAEKIRAEQTKPSNNQPTF